MLAWNLIELIIATWYLIYCEPKLIPADNISHFSEFQILWTQEWRKTIIEGMNKTIVNKSNIEMLCWMYIALLPSSFSTEIQTSCFTAQDRKGLFFDYG